MSSNISTDDMAFMYGFGLFETFLVDKDGAVFLLDKHIERMLSSARYFEINLPMDYVEIKSAVNCYINENKIRNRVVRITLSAGNKQLLISPSLIFTDRENLYTAQKKSEGFSLYISDIKKSENSVILRHKTTNYLENYIELKKIARLGYDDVLFVNTGNNITETAKCNIFFVKGNKLYTPHISCGLLGGIIRGWILENAPLFGLECTQGSFLADDLINADEAFITNSVIGITHICKIGENKVLRQYGITTRLQNELQRAYSNNLYFY